MKLAKPPQRFLAVAAGLGLAGLLLAGYAAYWRNLGAFVVDIDTLGACRWRDRVIPFCDFTQHFLPMAKAIRVATGPQEGYLYSPVLALLMRLLAFLGDRTAYLAWGGIVTACTLALYALPLASLFSSSLVASLAYTLLFFGCVPVLHNFAWGQVSVPILLLCLAGAALYQRQRRGAAAFLLALAAAIKFYPGVFILYPALRRDWRTAGLFVLWLALLLVAAPLAVMGPDRTLGFYRIIAQHIPGNAAFVSGTPYPQYVGTAVSFFFTGKSEFGSLLFRLLQVVGWGVAAGNVLLLSRVVRRRPAHEYAWASALLFTLTPFVAFWSWAHYFGYLPLVQGFALLLVARAGWPRWARAFGGAATLASCALSSLLFFELFASSDDYYRRGFLFLADALLLVPLWIGVLSMPAERSDAARSPADR